MIYFSSDQHFNHKNIIEYCKRPFTSIEEMNEKLIENWNRVVTKDDIIYNLGDFCFHTNGNSLQTIENRLNGRIVHIIGNHDSFSGLHSATIKYGGKKILMVHKPMHNKTRVGFDHDIVLCGHVHEIWKRMDFVAETSSFAEKEIPQVNVGVDVWNYVPVSIDSVLKFIRKGVDIMINIDEKYLRDNPYHVFVFGDNLKRTGKGGAARLRDFDNSYGFITKKSPDNEDESFYTIEEYKDVYNYEIEILMKTIENNPDYTYLISKVGSKLANKYGIFEAIIEPDIKNRLSIYRNVKFLW